MRTDYNPDDVFPENPSSAGEEWSGGHLIYAYQANDVAITLAPGQSTELALMFAGLADIFSHCVTDVEVNDSCCVALVDVLFKDLAAGDWRLQRHREVMRDTVTASVI